MEKKFYLHSTETNFSNLYFACYFKDVVGGDKDRAKKILVTIDPAIPKELYKTEEDIGFFVLAPRLEGCTVYPNISKPCFVYVCLPKENGSWLEGPYKILDWGEIVQEKP